MTYITRLMQLVFLFFSNKERGKIDPETLPRLAYSLLFVCNGGKPTVPNHGINFCLNPFLNFGIKNHVENCKLNCIARRLGSRQEQVHGDSNELLV